MQGKQEQVGKGGPTPPPLLPYFLHSAPLAAKSAKDIQQN